MKIKKLIKELKKIEKVFPKLEVYRGDDTAGELVVNSLEICTRESLSPIETEFYLLIEN
jgi:hypothetical protein